MKQLLAVFCFGLCTRSISQPVDSISNSPKAAGEKVLIKALAVIVNPEGNKKAPAKTIYLSSSDSPK